MTRYILRRLAYALLTFIGITVAVFALIHSVPGDPVVIYGGRLAAHQVAAGSIEAIRHEYGLDRPLPVQYARWVAGVVRLDFGRSILDRRPVIDRIAEKMPDTLVLNILAFVLAAGIGIPLGLWGAGSSRRLTDRTTAAVFLALYSLPSFWVSVLLMRWFALEHNWLPLFGAISDDYGSLAPLQKIGDRVAHLILPTVALSYGQLAIFARFSKAAVTEVVRQDYITAAKARGVAHGRLLWHHALRNALIPLITLFGVTVPYLMSGSVIVERIFQWDGVGRLYFDAVLNRDYPIVLGLTVLTAIVTLLATLVADLLYAAADPRVRLERSEP
jgi:peptide/nickel transport system permease protein